MRQRLVILPVLLLALVLAARATALQKAGQPQAAAPATQPAPAVAETYRGGLVDMGSTRGNGTASFELHLDSYTTDDEMARLATLESHQGPQALENELYRHRLGFIRIDQTLGYPVSMARRIPGPNGETIYAVMDRPLQIYEIWNSLPSRDYPFSVVEIQVGRDGKLSGNLYPIAQVDLIGRGGLHITNQLPQPFRLIGLERASK